MSKLDNLIKDRCPKGVKFSKIGELCEVVTPKGKVKSHDYKETGKYPVIDQSQNFIGGYTDEESSFDNGQYVVFGDHTCVVKFIDFQFVQGADGVKVLRAANGVKPKFLYYCMDNIRIEASYARHWSKMKEIKIPVPPLEVQNEIVQILDNFAELTAELTAELSNRKKQYEYYRDLLLNFDENEQREREE